MRRWTTGILLVTVAAGCREQPAERLGVALRDSAGVRIVEHRGAAPAAPAWRAEPAPALELGGAEGGNGPALYRVAEALRLGDGRIVVANGGSSALEIFGPNGAHLRSVGRAGDGPGEFRAVSWVGRMGGDTLAAWDSGLGRLSLFTPAGDFVRSVSPRRALGMYPQAVGALAGGGVVLALRGSALGMGKTTEVHVQRDTVTYAALSPSGDVRELARLPGAEMLVSGDPAGGLMVMPLPFGRQPAAAVAGDRVYVTDGERYEVAAYDAIGRLRAVLRSQSPRLPVTREDVRTYRDSLVTLGGEGNTALQRQQAELLDRAPYPRQKPAITALRADSAGNVWAESPVSDGEGLATEWRVISPDGPVIGSVRLPGRLDVRQIGPDWVLGIALDGDQAERVRLYKLVKPR
ncbi:MAG TPA: hypothetical protein VFS20_16680 [Longimicrobium sp.]|nr:hypothetical protein [Longimicrobium sp.]